MPWHTTVAGRVTGVVVSNHPLGMEEIYEFDVKDMPVTVAVRSDGTGVHVTRPREGAAKTGQIAVAAA